jgi:galactose mutarotase-like enzyme
MIFNLENDLLKVSFKQLGAELCSLYHKQTNTEHVWQADPKVWSRHAPILFPIVGQVENNTYRIGDQAYKLSQHGFARDRQFEVENQTPNSIVFLLKSDEESLKVYPYQFELRVVYTLTQHKLTIGYEVKNTDQQTIWFSIGAHPGFECPFAAGESFSEYLLEFDKTETVERMLFADGLLNGKKAPFLNNESKIELSHELFDGDAIILSNLKSTFVDLKNKSSKNALRFHFEGFPLLAFWTKPGAKADYLCIEPWFGVADTKGDNKDYREKAFIEKLELGGVFDCEYALEIVS